MTAHPAALTTAAIGLTTGPACVTAAVAVMTADPAVVTTAAIGQTTGPAYVTAAVAVVTAGPAAVVANYAVRPKEILPA